MELERTHTQLRDPKTREHVINTGDNLKREELYCRIGNFPAGIIVKPKKIYKLELRENVLLAIPRKERCARLTYFFFVLAETS